MRDCKAICRSFFKASTNRAYLPNELLWSAISLSISSLWMLVWTLPPKRWLHFSRSYSGWYWQV